jgi:energy-coupling factor transporter ATP-binding protein EcfA2
VGHIAGAQSIDALLDINKLVTRHSAIVGTTGSGKSTTVASLVATLSDETRFPSSRILILDIHGEYGKALLDKANVFKINPDARNKNEKHLHIPFWAMSFDELISITFGQIDDKEKGFILEKITELKRKAIREKQYRGISEQNLTVDTPVPFSIHRLWLYLHRLIYSTHSVPGTGQKFCNITEDFNDANTTEAFLIDDATNLPFQTGDAEKVIPAVYQIQKDKRIYLSVVDLKIRRPLDGLAAKLKDPRYDFLFKPGSLTPDLEGNTREDLSTLMKSWIGSDKRITILDLSGIPLSIMNDIIGILLRILYDALFWARKLSQGGRERPLLVVMEEAHSYLNNNNNSDSLASSIVQRIVKEGRKYGIGAMIVSQRPSEINPTILSQCGTFFALRLSNLTDRSHITGAISDNLESLTNMLPVLRTGEALILGEAVKLPMRTIIEAPPKNRRPDSQDPIVCDEVIGELSMHPGGWNIRMEPNPNYDELMLVWRQQNPTLPNIQKK